MPAFIIKNPWFYTSINIIKTNSNINTTLQCSESLFMGFLIAISNLKNLKPSVKYKEKAINSITQHLYNYLIYKLYKGFLLKIIKFDNISR